MENFDPIGRWRENYPIYAKSEDGKVVTKKGLPVEAESELTDGTNLRDVKDLKGYLVNNIDTFSACLAEKLLMYSTGRDLSYADRPGSTKHPSTHQTPRQWFP